MSSTDFVIEAHDLWKSFDHGRIPVIEGVDLKVQRGELLALWGASGSGKSTLLHLLSGLDLPDRGTISVLGLDATVERNRLELRRRHVGYVFQLHNLIPDLSLEENLRIPAVAAHCSEADTAARVDYLTSQVGLGHRLRHRVQDLSGGERQRTAICRALMNRPKLIFADEPTGSLDEETGMAVFQLLQRLVVEENVSVLLATHERRFVEGCHRVLRVSKGRITPL
ncbi:MAG: ATP-binding cassette domain-containing protein [Chthoniobacter sp.]|nr:ATP-binding cassette domain-containing protein [Chthoniobacter sp.]